MSDPLVSVLMPTRNPIHWLIRALDSIKSTASDYSRVEVILRIDDDDQERIDKMPILEERYGAKCLVGPRGEGYNDMPNFLNQLAKAATGEWSWLFDDDAWVTGPWMDRLAELQNNTAANAQWYYLGGSRYCNSPYGGPAGLILPTTVVKSITHRLPVDDQWLSVAIQKGWTVTLLRAVTYWHDGRRR